MSTISTKEQLFLYLHQVTDGNLLKAKHCTTSEISDENHISRSLTSQYLNELNKEGKVIKVASRPVYYFSTSALERLYQVSMHEYEFYDMEELRNYLEKGRYQYNDFQSVIGSEGTLSYCTMQMKAAMLYPSHGLPVILQGVKGSGKAYLAEMMYEFCMNKELISKQSKYITDYCSPLSYDDILFGSVKDGELLEGLIAKAKNGLLYLANADGLNAICQQRLAEYIKTGRYMIDHSHTLESQTRIVLGVEQDANLRLHESLFLNIPVICEIPALSSRVQGEREEMIIDFLGQEANALHREIQLSKVLYQSLVTYHFNDSIDEMHNVIRLTCANAYAQDVNDTYMPMHIKDMPISVFKELDVLLECSSPEEMYTLAQIHMSGGKQQIFDLYKMILHAHQAYQQGKCNEKEWIANGLEAMRHYYDYIVFEQQDDDIAMRCIQAKLEELISEVEKRNQITLPLNCSFILARMVYAMYRTQSEVQLWEHQHKEEIQDCLHTMEYEFADMNAMAGMIIHRIHQVMDVKLGCINTIFLVLNIHFYNCDVVNHDTCGVIISHGYSTATSIADASNQLLQSQVFKAIDMPLDLDVFQIQKKLERFVQLHPYYRNLILMVDMGSLEDIAANLQADSNIGVINNISTGLALDIGNRILQHEELEEVLHNACKGCICRYRILSKNEKEKAIVFTSEVGIKVASKLADLFKNSLPKTIHLKFIEYEYERLQVKGKSDILFEKYDVILLIKPDVLKIEGIYSLSLEDLIGFKTVSNVNELLSHYLKEEEIDSFNKHLIKNFSLQSIMENLTILNPGRLLDQVSEAISQLQLLMQRKFQSKTIIGIYMHTCFLIERLVTKTAILSNDMELFEEEHQGFIGHINLSFEKMLRNYSVEIPSSEISYLYDYIQNEE